MSWIIREEHELCPPAKRPGPGKLFVSWISHKCVPTIGSTARTDAATWPTRSTARRFILLARLRDSKRRPFTRYTIERL